MEVVMLILGQGIHYFGDMLVGLLEVRVELDSFGCS